MSNEKSDKSEKESPKEKHIGFGMRITTVFGHEPKEEIAERLGVSLDTVYAWMKGNQLPQGRHIIKIREHYKISCDWLLGGKRGSRGNTAVLIERDVLNDHPYIEEILRAAEKKDDRLLVKMLEYALEKARK